MNQRIRFSNFQICGFVGLFLVNCIWMWYALEFGQFFRDEHIFKLLKDLLPHFGVYVGIPLSISLLISYRMYTHQMLSRLNYFVILGVGFMISFIFVISRHMSI